jgi:hypothetical protein
MGTYENAGGGVSARKRVFDVEPGLGRLFAEPSGSVPSARKPAVPEELNASAPVGTHT